MSSEYADVEQIHQTLGDVAVERLRQNQIFGIQHHPAGTGEEVAIPLGYWKPGQGAFYRLEVIHGHGTIYLDPVKLAAMLRERCRNRVADHEATWVDILMEEVFELLAETEPGKVYTEAIQVSAVAAALAESIARVHPEVVGGTTAAVQA